MLNSPCAASCAGGTQSTLSGAAAGMAVSVYLLEKVCLFHWHDMAPDCILVAALTPDRAAARKALTQVRRGPAPRGLPKLLRQGDRALSKRGRVASVPVQVAGLMGMTKDSDARRSGRSFSVRVGATRFLVN